MKLTDAQAKYLRATADGKTPESVRSGCGAHAAKVHAMRFLRKHNLVTYPIMYGV